MLRAGRIANVGGTCHVCAASAKGRVTSKAKGARHGRIYLR